MSPAVERADTLGVASDSVLLLYDPVLKGGPMAQMQASGLRSLGEMHVLDVATVIDGAAFRGVPMRVFLFTTLAMMADGFDIQSLAFAAPALIPAWGISRAELAPVLAAGLIGMGLGAMIGGGAGDRWGRRMALLGCMLLVAIASLLCGGASNRAELGVLRFVVGLGLGGAMPNASALISECSPARHRSVALASTVIGVPLGGLLGAELAAHIVPAFGWRSVFIVGGILPGLLAMAIWRGMPESPYFLARRVTRHPELLELLQRISGRPFDPGAQIRAPQQVSTRPGGSVRQLFTAALRRNTLALWFAFASSTFVVYCYFSWLPTVLASQRLAVSTSIRGALAFNLGGVAGGLAVGWLIGRFGARRALLGAAAIGFAATALTGLAPVSPDRSVAPLMIGLAIVGWCVNAVQIGLFVVAARVYPTECRARGIGWCLGMARFGGVFSAFAGGSLLAVGSGARPFFLGVACVNALVILGLLLLRNPGAEAHAGAAAT